MRALRPLGLLCLLFSLHVPPVAGADRLQGLLPPGSHLLAENQVPGVPGIVVLVYRNGRDYVGVATLGQPRRLTAQHILPGSFLTLRVAHHSGIVRMLSAVDSTGKQWACAFVIVPTAVRTAVRNKAKGCVSGDEGVHLDADGFTVRNRDQVHVGSVRYRVLARYRWSRSAFAMRKTVRRPDYPSSDLPLPNGTVHTASGDVILVRLEIAATEQQRETGLMNRRVLDPDTGMVFEWPQTVTDPSGPTTVKTQAVHDSFWMENTYIPLSIAFLSENGVVQEVQDMQPLSTELHTPVHPYNYAIEANLGFFSINGIRVGDRVMLHLPQSLIKIR
ncbi:MAG: hypothetical protein NVS4B2_00150 [Chloroflexota bacterium]